MKTPREEGNKGHRIYTKELALEYIDDHIIRKPAEVSRIIKRLKIFSFDKDILLVKSGLGNGRLGACDYLEKYYMVVFV